MTELLTHRRKQTKQTRIVNPSGSCSVDGKRFLQCSHTIPTLKITKASVKEQSLVPKSLHF